MSVTYKLAKAIFLSAQEKKVLAPVYEDLKHMASFVELSEFRACLSPLIDKKSIEDVIIALGKKYKWQPYSTRFLQICAANKRLHLIPKVVSDFALMYDQAQKILRAKVTSSQELSKTDKANLVKIITQHCRDKKIEVNYDLDPKMVGGFIAKFDSYVIDKSITSRLADIKQSMLNVVQS